MMTIFTGFSGRINRAKYWLGSIIVAVIGFVLLMILMPIFGVSGMLTDPALAAAQGRTVAIIQIIILAIIGYSATALIMKRLNDRDRPSYLAYVFWAPTVLMVLGGLLGLTTNMDGTQTSLGLVLLLLSVVIGIWALIELGILKGTDGPNQHGPDPLAK